MKCPPTVTSCLCVLDLKPGSIVIGWVCLIIKGLMLISTILLLAGVKTLKNVEPINGGILSKVVYIELIVLVIEVVVAILLLFGLYKDKKNFIKWWLIANVIIWVIYIIFALLLVIQMIVLDLILNVIVICIYAYFIIVVYSYYQTL